jgi:hypothetical protein
MIRLPWVLSTVPDSRCCWVNKHCGELWEGRGKNTSQHDLHGISAGDVEARARIMDLANTIRDLRAEVQRIEATITALESLTGSEQPAPHARKPGRKSMGLEERQQVSERMRRYWAARRTARTATHKLAQPEKQAGASH